MKDATLAYKNTPILAILTLRRHKDGVWIQRLVDALKQHKCQDREGTLFHVEVVVLEDFLSQPFCVSSN